MTHGFPHPLYQSGYEAGRKESADEIERLREELYEIKLAAAGGEDAPGAANMVTANDVEKWVTKYCEEIERLREALAVIYKAADKERDENDEYWWVDNQTTVQAYICSVLGAPPNAALGEGKE